ncbi:hypothetical protein GOP47_0026127 [Adiantum capillus-veneris]|uniref:Uncharacterized protein n=1 Tax=Adiantum capillus-veneris TaxID=13818 RepID=A0A9D4U1R6_ADICA|nr:hypothetical protein GOP47_0025707 [Adiantum capillus-veneris]KAI5059808.1 hypothetical protein GOP47_0026127 [Adiantum capillus-veneris]
MKYMKLGFKPDIFHSEQNVTTVATELVSDVVFVVEGRRYHLHKFPLLSKCGRLQSLAISSSGSLKDEIDIQDIPGGAEAFEICAKFCYCIVITLNAFNVMAVRCAAEYLEMTEAMEKGNLGFKLEVFLNSSIFRSWKDTIISLQATEALLPWAEDLKIVSRCIDSISTKACVDPAKVEWSFTHARASLSNLSLPYDGVSPPWNGIHSGRNQTIPQDWWIEDICELDIDLYWRVMLAIKAKGRISSEVVGEALRVYAHKWLPGVSKDQNLVETVRGGAAGYGDDFIESASQHKLLLETIVSLLPLERGSCSCSFLLKLLKAATILGAAPSSKMELAKRIGLQLDEASLNDLLIPSLSYANDSLYDVDLVQCIVEHFILQDQSPARSPTSQSEQLYERRRTKSAEHLELGESQHFTTTAHNAKLKVAKLVDGYLAEVARDTNLALSKFITLAELIPDFARPVHDSLYRAIDVYLKEHPGLTKTERKRICRLMDCKRLSMDACMHAAQNERLPLRVVVQVLFFEQVRTAMAGGFLMNDLPSNIKALMPRNESLYERAQSALTPEEDWEAVQNDCTALKSDLDIMKQSIAEAERVRSSMHKQVVKHSKAKAFPFHPKKLFSRLWSSVHQVGTRIPGSPESSEMSTNTSRQAMSKERASRRRRHSVS